MCRVGIRDAADLGYLVTVACDACAAFSPSDHEFGLKNMKGSARILTTEQVLQELSNPQPLETLKVNSFSVPRDDPAALPISPLTTVQVSVSDAQSTATTTQATDPAAIDKAAVPSTTPNRQDTQLPPKFPKLSVLFCLHSITPVSSFSDMLLPLMM